MRLLKAFGIILFTLAANSRANADFIAYDVPVLTSNSTLSGSLGLSFVVNSSITVTQLGIFDNAGEVGLSSSHIVSIYNATGGLVATTTIPAGTSATLVNGSRFVSIAPAVLGAGTYSVVASNLSGTDSYFAGDTGTTTNTGGGLINFLTGYGVNLAADSFPNSNMVTSSTTSIAAGTFQFTSNTIPEPGSLALIVIGISGVFALRSHSRIQPRA